MFQTGLVFKHVGTDFLELWGFFVRCQGYPPWDGLYPLEAFQKHFLLKSVPAKEYKAGNPPSSVKKMSIIQLMVVLQFLASLVEEWLRNYGWLRMITASFLLKSWWFFLINFLEVKWCDFLRVCWRGVFVVKFNTIRNNTLQDTGSEWFGLEFFKHQVARLIDEYHIEIFSFAAYTLLWRYHTEYLLHKSPWTITSDTFLCQRYCQALSLSMKVKHAVPEEVSWWKKQGMFPMKMLDFVGEVLGFETLSCWESIFIALNGLKWQPCRQFVTT